MGTEQVTSMAAKSKPSRSVPAPKIVRTGVGCQACKEPVAVVQHTTYTSLTLYCLKCGHRWVATGPGYKPH